MTARDRNYLMVGASSALAIHGLLVGEILGPLILFPAALLFWSCARDNDTHPKGGDRGLRS